MPIYAYKCGSCGHAKDVLQKISDPVLSTCPACGAESFTKQITSAGFHLKGSGWYASDFRGGSKDPSAPKPEDKTAEKGAEKGAEKATDKPADSGKGESPPAAKPDAPSAAAGGCGGSCACH